MKNLIKRILLVLTVLTAGIAQTAFGVNASAYYTRYTHEFLGYLGQNNPTAVQISKITPNDRFYKGAAGYACAAGIYINEDLLASKPFPEAVKLFTCAHEAAHFALGHPYQVRRPILEIEQEADETAARMLCNNGYRWIVQGHVNNLNNLVKAGLGDSSDKVHPTYRQQHRYLSAILGNPVQGNVGNAAPKANQGNAVKRNPVKPVVQKPVTRKPVAKKPVKPAPRTPVKAAPKQNGPKNNQIKPAAKRNGAVANNRAIWNQQIKKAAVVKLQGRQNKKSIWGR